MAHAETTRNLDIDSATRLVMTLPSWCGRLGAFTGTRTAKGQRIAVRCYRMAMAMTTSIATSQRVAPWCSTAKEAGGAAAAAGAAAAKPFLARARPRMLAAEPGRGDSRAEAGECIFVRLST